jgi:hypothetical protein
MDLGKEAGEKKRVIIYTFLHFRFAVSEAR